MVCAVGTCVSKAGVPVSCWATGCCFPGANLTVSLQTPGVHFSCICAEFDSKCSLVVGAEASQLLAAAGMLASAGAVLLGRSLCKGKDSLALCAICQHSPGRAQLAAADFMHKCREVCPEMSPCHHG